MADEEQLRLPLEVPWKLASTTQTLKIGGPNEVSISTFFFEPVYEDITANFPGERLVFKKFSVSISPGRLAAGDPELAVGFLGEDLPVLYVMLDLKVKPASRGNRWISSLFSCSCTLKPRMLQTGVIGDDLYESEASAQHIGKSGSQLYESLDSSSRTTTFGGGAGFSIGPVGIGASARTSNTSISSERTVN